MTRFTRCIAIMMALGTTTLAARAQDAPPGDATNGKKIYLATGCVACHGSAGQGGAYNGVVPPLAKTAMPYVAFKFQLRTPAREMPAYSETVMDEQAIADIYAFMQSVPGRREVKDIGILNN